MQPTGRSAYSSRWSGKLGCRVCLSYEPLYFHSFTVLTNDLTCMVGLDSCLPFLYSAENKKSKRSELMSLHPGNLLSEGICVNEA